MRTNAEKQHGKTTSTKAHREIETKGVGSPISNDAYNVIAALHSKLEGLEAYRKYAKDGCESVWKELTDIEMEGVITLVDELERMVESGKLRMSEPGESGH